MIRIIALDKRRNVYLMNFYPQNISQKNVYQRNLHMIFTMVVALDKGMGVCLVNVYLMNFHPQNIFPRNVFFQVNTS